MSPERTLNPKRQYCSLWQGSHSALRSYGAEFALADDEGL